MKKLIMVLMAMCMMFSSAALVAERFSVAFEAKSLNIKLSNDRTGIVQKVVCEICSFNIVKITPATRTYVNGSEVDLLRAKSRSRKSATVIFYLDTREVQKITWVE